MQVVPFYQLAASLVVTDQSLTVDQSALGGRCISFHLLPLVPQRLICLLVHRQQALQHLWLPR